MFFLGKYERDPLFWTWSRLVSLTCHASGIIIKPRAGSNIQTTWPQKSRNLRGAIHEISFYLRNWYIHRMWFIENVLFFLHIKLRKEPFIVEQNLSSAVLDLFMWVKFSYFALKYSNQFWEEFTFLWENYPSLFPSIWYIYILYI